jgi:transcriptional regulator with XRE-family HTH domain
MMAAPSARVHPLSDVVIPDTKNDLLGRNVKIPVVVGHPNPGRSRSTGKHGMIGIGQRLKAARLRARMTQEQAAEAATVARTTITNWEAGRNLRPLVQFRALMALFGASPYHVLFGESMFKFTKDEYTELQEHAKLFSPSLRRKVELMIALQVIGDMDQTPA